MRTSLVNGLALAFAASALSTACSKADGRAAVVPPPGDTLYTRADTGRTAGNPASKVWIVEVSDFQCPYCKDWHDKYYSTIRDEYVKTGKVRLAFVNFPLPMHGNARSASTAAMCASAQGKFWPMHDALFQNQEKWEALQNPSSYFESLATKAGVDMPTYRACTASKSIQTLIDVDMERARRAGVQATPSFIIGGQLYEGALPTEDLRKAINEQLSPKK